MNNYTSNFRVGLLDDLHNYFPDLLYNSERFTTVQDVLQYVQNQARSQFNPFENGRNAYRAHMQIRSAQQQQQIQTQQSQQSQQLTPIQVQESGPTGVVTPNRPTTTTATGTSPSTLMTPVRIQRSIPINLNPPRITRRYQPFNHYTAILDDLNDENLIGINTLGSLSNLSNLFSLALNPPMNDVVIVPTAQQLNNATTLISSQETNDDCAICQELMDTNLRKINRCNHIFHQQCIETWFQSSVTCPICRIDIRDAQ
jgi:Ring finger domain